MKAHAFAQALKLVSATLDEDAREAAMMFAEALRKTPLTTTVAATIKKLDTAVAENLVGQASHNEDSVASLSVALERLRELAAAIGTKPAITAIASLKAIVDSNPTLSLPAFIASISRKPARPKPVANDSVVATHVAALLSAAPGTPAFEKALDQISADGLAKGPEVRAIAARVGCPVAETATKPTALKRIGEEHKIIMDTRRKADALRGNNSA